MSEKITLWIARDADKGKQLYLYKAKPTYNKEQQFFYSHSCDILEGSCLFPEIRAGECYEATLELAQKIELER